MKKLRFLMLLCTMGLQAGRDEVRDAQLAVQDRINLYADLGVAQSASPADIKKAYFRLRSTMHPDKAQISGKSKQYLQEKFQAVGRAYRILSDNDGRREYNRSYKASWQPTPLPDPTALSPEEILERGIDTFLEKFKPYLEADPTKMTEDAFRAQWKGLLTEAEVFIRSWKGLKMDERVARYRELIKYRDIAQLFAGDARSGDILDRDRTAEKYYENVPAAFKKFASAGASSASGAGGSASGSAGGGTWAGYGGGASAGGGGGASGAGAGRRAAEDAFREDIRAFNGRFNSTITKNPESFTNFDLYNEWSSIVSSANALLSRWPITWNVGHGPHQELKNMRDIATVFESLPSATPSQKKIMLDDAAANSYFTKLVKGRMQVGRPIDQLIGSGQYNDAIAAMRGLTPLTSAKIIATYIQQINGLKDRHLDRALNQVLVAMKEYDRLNQEINTIGITLPKLQAEYEKLLRLDAQLKAQSQADRRAREEAERWAREQEERARQEARDAELARKRAQEEAERRGREDAERAKREQEAARRAQEEAARRPRPGAGGGAAGAAGAADPYAGMSARDRRIAERRAQRSTPLNAEQIQANIDEFVKSRGI